jgi:hypothetical protein
MSLIKYRTGRNINKYVESYQQIQNLSYFDIIQYIKLENVDITHINHLPRGWITFEINNTRLQTLTGIPEGIINICCMNNRIMKLNVSGLTHLTHLDCMNNCLTELDLDGCVGLKNLNCSKNELRDIRLEECSKLIGLSIK